MSTSIEAANTVENNLEHQPRLLVVDDESMNSKALQLYLERQGYSVHIAYSGKQALKEIDTFKPDLLIVDLNMPDISGLELTLQVRQNPQLNYLPVIIITAQDEERKRLQSMVSGADDYLAKPVAERELLVRVQALLRTKAHLDRLIIEKRILLQDLEQQNSQLERVVRRANEVDILKRNILNTVSHEMGTPMLQIKSAVHLLVEDIRRNDPDSTPARLATEAVTRMEGIIQNLTDLARSENLKRQGFILNEAIDLAVRSIERSWIAREQVSRIKREIPDGLPTVAGDRRGVARVLQLLIENALKFDPSGQPVVIKAAAMHDDTVKISVCDEGIGIPAKEIKRIFEPFYQIDSSTTRPFPGMGVGLALAKLLCDQMDTSITVESRPKKGSIFSFPLSTKDIEVD